MTSKMEYMEKNNLCGNCERINEECICRDLEYENNALKDKHKEILKRDFD